jgi:oligopeptide transport system permease protein
MKDIDKSKLVFISETDERIQDLPLETKEIGYYKDVWNRFKTNKASFVAFIIICVIFFFILVGPYMKVYDFADKEATYGTRVANLPPKMPILEKFGIFDGTTTIERGKKFLLELYNSPNGKKIILKGLPQELIDNPNHPDYYNIDSLKVKVDAYEYCNYINSYKDEANSYAGVQFTLTEEEYQDALAHNYIIDVLSISVSDNNGVKSNQYIVRVDFFLYGLVQKTSDTYFWFGTNSNGQDLFTKLWVGARISLLMALAVIIINSIIGISIGAISGYYGGTFDLLFDRFVEILGGIPFLAVLTLLVMAYGSSIFIILIAFTATGWIGSYGMGRMQFYRYKNREYVLAAKTLGAKDSRIMFKHIFPNALGYMVTSFALAIPSFVFSEATYSFLGIINYSDATSVGMLLQEGQSVMTTYPHLLIFPAIYISILMITFNLFGNGLRDAFNPSLRGTE